jgi:hypothetical protein
LRIHKSKEEGRRKKEEGRRKKEKGRRKLPVAYSLEGRRKREEGFSYHCKNLLVSLVARLSFAGRSH